MLRRSFTAAILALCTATSAQLASGSATEASEEEVPAGSRAIYVHPVMTIISTGVDQLPSIIPLTAEFELEGAKSFIVQPTLTYGSAALEKPSGAPSYFPDPKDLEILEVDIAVGLRKYLNGAEHRGMYLGASLATGYASIDRPGTDYYYDHVTGSGFVVGGLGYLGYRSIWDAITIYSDVGLGYRYMSLDLEGDDKGLEVSKTGVAFDLNLGIGYRF